MKLLNKILILSLIIVLIPNFALATNTYSVDLELDSSQFLSIAGGDQTGLNITTDGTFEFWVRLETAPGVGGQQVFLQKMEYGDTPANLAYYFSYYNEGGTYKLRWVDSTDGQNFAAVINATQTITVDTWTHIAAVKNGTDLEYFVNGSSIGSVTVSGTLYNSAALFTIGSFYNAGGYSLFLDGKMDEVRVWNDVRTSTEISDNYQKELVGNEAGLVAYWKLNNSLLDETSSNNDLTNNNSATYSTDVPFVGATQDPCTPTPGEPFFQPQDCYITTDVYHNERWIVDGVKLIPDGGKIIIDY